MAPLLDSIIFPFCRRAGGEKKSTGGNSECKATTLREHLILMVENYGIFLFYVFVEANSRGKT